MTYQHYLAGGTILSANMKMIAITWYIQLIANSFQGLNVTLFELLVCINNLLRTRWSLDTLCMLMEAVEMKNSNCESTIELRFEAIWIARKECIYHGDRSKPRNKLKGWVRQFVYWKKTGQSFVSFLNFPALHTPPPFRLSLLDIGFGGNFQKLCSPRIWKSGQIWRGSPLLLASVVVPLCDWFGGKKGRHSESECSFCKDENHELMWTRWRSVRVFFLVSTL